MKFSREISDHVKVQWVKGIGTVAVVLDEWFFPILDLTELSYKAAHNKEEARHYVGIQICNFLKNRTSKEHILNDYWMNQYLEQAEIKIAIETVIANVTDMRYERLFV